MLDGAWVWRDRIFMYHVQQSCNVYGYWIPHVFRLFRSIKPKPTISATGGQAWYRNHSVMHAGFGGRYHVVRPLCCAACCFSIIQGLCAERVQKGDAVDVGIEMGRPQDCQIQISTTFPVDKCNFDVFWSEIFKHSGHRLVLTRLNRVCHPVVPKSWFFSIFFKDSHGPGHTYHLEYKCLGGYVRTHKHSKGPCSTRSSFREIGLCTCHLKTYCTFQGHVAQFFSPCLQNVSGWPRLEVTRLLVDICCKPRRLNTIYMWFSLAAQRVI